MVFCAQNHHWYAEFMRAFLNRESKDLQQQQFRGLCACRALCGSAVFSPWVKVTLLCRALKLHKPHELGWSFRHWGVVGVPIDLWMCTSQCNHILCSCSLTELFIKGWNEEGGGFFCIGISIGLCSLCAFSQYITNMSIGRIQSASHFRMLQSSMN